MNAFLVWAVEATLALVLLTLVAWTFVRVARPAAIVENAIWRTVLVLQILVPLAIAVAKVNPAPSWRTTPAMSWVPDVESTMPAWLRESPVVLSAAAAPEPVSDKPVPTGAPTLPNGLACAWAAGVLLMLLRLAGSLRAVARLRREALPAEDGQRRELARLAPRFGVRKPDLLLHPDSGGPLLIGWRRPAIVIAEPVAPEVLAHELAHLARRDLWWGGVARLVQAAWFFHPAVTLTRRRMERSAEECCDDLVVLTSGDRVAYAEELARHAAQRAVPVLALGMTPVRSRIGRRIVRVLDQTRPLRAKLGRVAGALCLGSAAATAACALVACPGKSAPRENVASPTPPPKQTDVREKAAEPTPSQSSSGPLIRGIDVIPVGQQPFSTEELIRLSGLEVGQPYRERDIEEAVRRIYASGKVQNVRVFGGRFDDGVLISIVYAAESGPDQQPGSQSQRDAGPRSLIDGVAASVNGEVILYRQVREIVGARERALAGSYSGDQLKQKITELRLAAHKDLVDRLLLLQEFRSRHGSLPNWATDARFWDVCEREFGGDYAIMEATLREHGITPAEFWMQEREKLTVQAMREEITKGATNAEEREARFAEWAAKRRAASKIKEFR